MDLRRQRIVAGLAAIADDGPHDQPFDQEEDRDGDDEDDAVEVADLGALGRDRNGRVEALDHPCAGARDDGESHHDEGNDDHHHERGGAGAAGAWGARHPVSSASRRSRVGARRIGSVKRARWRAAVMIPGACRRRPARQKGPW